MTHMPNPPRNLRLQADDIKPMVSAMGRVA